MSVPIHPAQAEPDEPCHRVEVTIQPLVQHDDEKSERRKSQRVATTGGKPVRAPQSQNDDYGIENEPEESEAGTRVAEITLSTDSRRRTQTPGRRCDRAGTVPDRLREG